VNVGALSSPDRQSSRRFWTVKETALLLRLSEPTLYRAIHAGEFPAVRVRGRIVIPALLVDAMERRALETGSVVDAASWVMDRDDAA
jgi:excisionase family DNA binding protein